MSDGGVVDVQKFLNAHRFSGFQWLIFALCFAIVFLDGFDTAAIGYIAPALVSEWAVERLSTGTGVNRCGIRIIDRSALRKTSSGQVWSQDGACRVGIRLRGRLPCICFLR